MIDWNTIETVFLDMDGTLLDLHYDNYFWMEHLPSRYAQIKGIAKDEAIDQLRGMSDRHYGSLNWYCIDYWSETLDLDIVALKREVMDRIGYRPNARKFLQYIHGLGLDVALVTNAHQHSIELKLEQTDLGDQIDEIITSHDLKMPKEDVAFWHKLQSIRHYQPGLTAFFDDNDAVLKSAEASGIKYLFSIAQPDSRRQKERLSEYPELSDFADIFPANE